MKAEVEKIKKHTRRGRPVLLNDVLKQSIILYKSTNPDWPAKKILSSIKINYFNKLRRVHPDWPDSKIRELTAFPGVNRVQRYLKEISPHVNQKSPLEEKWHMGTVQNYPITPEAVKKIFELKARGKDYISIRIARWISRLSALPLPIDMLYLFAMEYSTAEEIAEISRTELNTANLDRIVLENLKNLEESGNGSKKQAQMPVKNDVLPIINVVPPVNKDITASKTNIPPIKNDIETAKVKSPLPRAKVTLVKRDIEDIKAKAAPPEAEITSEETKIPPEKIDVKSVKKDVVPAKPDTVTEKTDIEPEEKEPAEDEKPKDEKPAAGDKQRESFRKFNLPDMHKRQASIEAFLKFVEKQKDKE